MAAIIIPISWVLWGSGPDSNPLSPPLPECLCMFQKLGLRIVTVDPPGVFHTEQHEKNKQTKKWLGDRRPGPSARSALTPDLLCDLERVTALSGPQAER